MTEKTYQVTIHVGLKIRETGEVQPIEKAEKICQEFVDEVGECVSLTPTTYIYTNGNEPGAIIGFIQYPRFPKSPQQIEERALKLAYLLKNGLSQLKVSIISPTYTHTI